MKKSTFYRKLLRNHTTIWQTLDSQIHTYYSNIINACTTIGSLIDEEGSRFGVEFPRPNTSLYEPLSAYHTFPQTQDQLDCDRSTAMFEINKLIRTILHEFVTNNRTLYFQIFDGIIKEQFDITRSENDVTLTHIGIDYEVDFYELEFEERMRIIDGMLEYIEENEEPEYTTSTQTVTKIKDENGNVAAVVTFNDNNEKHVEYITTDITPNLKQIVEELKPHEGENEQ